MFRRFVCMDDSSVEKLVWKGKSFLISCQLLQRVFAPLFSGGIPIWHGMGIYIWTPWPPMRVAAFLWRLFNNVIAVDTRVQREKVVTVWNQNANNAARICRS
uniref:Uncharacterized protein n=1 Tax=Kalanchoe fedtschenkoi TaxID=63787 RepID=A0A7N0T481_KALFE